MSCCHFFTANSAYLIRDVSWSKLLLNYTITLTQPYYKLHGHLSLMMVCFASIFASYSYAYHTRTVDAIIFLAPISAFDQALSEDRTINRLEDSVLLWKAVCSNQLLANVDLILFLNKCDILDQKLNKGIRMAKYVRSYQDRENNMDTILKCEFNFLSI